VRRVHPFENANAVAVEQIKRLSDHLPMSGESPSSSSTPATIPHK